MMYTTKRIEGGKTIRDVVENGGLVERLTKDGTYDQYILKDEVLSARTYNVEEQSWTDFKAVKALNWTGRYNDWYVIRDEDGKDIRIGRFIEKVMYRKPFLMDILPNLRMQTTAPPEDKETTDENPNLTLVRRLSEEFNMSSMEVIAALQNIGKEGIASTLDAAVDIFRVRKTADIPRLIPTPASVQNPKPETTVLDGVGLCKALLDGKTVRIGNSIARIRDNVFERCHEGQDWEKDSLTLNGILGMTGEVEEYTLTFQQAIEKMKKGATCIPQMRNQRYWLEGSSICSQDQKDGFQLAVMESMWRVVDDENQEE